jgi:hypothetical protein
MNRCRTEGYEKMNNSRAIRHTFMSDGDRGTTTARTPAGILAVLTSWGGSYRSYVATTAAWSLQRSSYDGARSTSTLTARPARAAFASW